MFILNKVDETVLLQNKNKCAVEKEMNINKYIIINIIHIFACLFIFIYYIKIKNLYKFNII